MKKIAAEVAKIPYKFKKWTFGYNCLLFQIEEAYLEKINLNEKIDYIYNKMTQLNQNCPLKIYLMYLEKLIN